MRSSDERLLVVGEWVQKAENDLSNAVQTLKMGNDCPTDTVCFHVQQCVEKYLKALLIYEDKVVIHTHHINTLMVLLPHSIRPELTPKEQAILTNYAVTTRYPGDYDLISLTEARRAVRIARRVRKHVRELLPKFPIKQ